MHGICKPFHEVTDKINSTHGADYAGRTSGVKCMGVRVSCQLCTWTERAETFNSEFNFSRLIVRHDGCVLEKSSVSISVEKL